MQARIDFADASGYESFMGRWSRAVVVHFLRWIRPPRGVKWLDVGCGTGILTEALLDLCEPASVVGIDPSGRTSRAGIPGTRRRACEVSAGRRHEPAFPRWRLRHHRFGARHQLHSRSSDGAEGDAARYGARRHGGWLCLGYGTGTLSKRTVPPGDASVRRRSSGRFRGPRIQARRPSSHCSAAPGCTRSNA